MPVATDHVELVMLDDPRSPTAEAYRTLRTNIQLTSVDHPVGSLLVTSASQNEGKTTTLANLAVTFAQAGNRVLLVDCDLRRPTLHRVFGIENDRGLTTMLLHEGGEAPLAATRVENLRVLTSGPLPPSPSEMLGTKRFESVFARLKTEAELVLFDSPPVLAVSDASILSRQVDGVLLVVSAGTTKRDHAQKARLQLERAGARLLGVVLNNARLDSSVYGYYA